jgi:hypothetical protein
LASYEREPAAQYRYVPAEPSAAPHLPGQTARAPEAAARGQVFDLIGSFVRQNR